MNTNVEETRPQMKGKLAPSGVERNGDKMQRFSRLIAVGIQRSLERQKALDPKNATKSC
jgi:hypothetical protein